MQSRPQARAGSRPVDSRVDRVWPRVVWHMSNALEHGEVGVRDLRRQRFGMDLQRYGVVGIAVNDLDRHFDLPVARHLCPDLLEQVRPVKGIGPHRDAP